MKKIRKIVIVIIALIIMPLTVKADMGAPEITSYEVVVKNKDGAQTYNYDGTEQNYKIEYDKKVKIIEEITIDDEEYVGFYQDDITYFIKSKDISLLNEIDFSQFSKVKNNKELYVIKDGAELYKGPSKVYGVINDIKVPVGTTLKVEYEDELWSYVEYNGTKGWIYSFSYSDYSPYENIKNSVCDVVDASLIVVNEQVKLFETTEDNSKFEIITIPQNTIINYSKVLYDSPHSKKIYIEYNDNKGWIILNNDDINGVGLEEDYTDTKDFKLILINDTEMYDSPINKKVISSIKANTKIEVSNEFYYNDANMYESTEEDYFYYIEYNGLKGWIQEKNIAKYENKKIMTVTSIELNEKYNNDNVVGKIEKNKEIKGYYYFNVYSKTPFNEYYYIEKNNNSGWVLNEGNIANYTSDCNQELVLENNGIFAVSTKDNLQVQIPKLSILDNLYTYRVYNNNNNVENRSYIRYNNEYYWITTTNIELASRNKNISYKLKPDYIKESLHVYNDTSLTKEAFDITDNEKFDVLFKYYAPNKGIIFYINYKGQKGWIIPDSEKYNEIDVEQDNCLLKDLNSNNKIKKDDENIKDNEPIKRIDKNPISNTKTIIIGVIVAIILALSSIMTIILINKKGKIKKDNKEEHNSNKEENTNK